MAGYMVKCVYLNTFNMKNKAILLFCIMFRNIRKNTALFQGSQDSPAFPSGIKVQISMYQLQTKWTKMTWKTFDETIRRG